MAASNEDIAKKASTYAARGKYRKALKLYQKLENHRGVGLMYEKLGKKNDAVDNYVRAADFMNAAKRLDAMGEKELAAQMYVKAGSPRQAAQVLIEIDNPLSAARMYEKAGDIEQAAELYEEAGRFSAAAALYEKCDQIDRAIRIYEENERPELAARLCANTGDFLRAAELYASMEIHAEAARCYEMAEKKEDAIASYRKAEALEEAIELCEQIGDHAQAGELCEQLDNTERAVAFFAKAGKYAMAGRLYEEDHLYYEAARMYAKDKDTLAKAGDLYRNTLSSESVWKYAAESPIWGLAVAEQAGRVAIGVSSGEVVVTDKGGEELWTFRIPMGMRFRSFAITHDASRLAIGTEGRAVYMLDASNRLLWKREVGGEVRGLKFIDNNQFLAAACTDGYLRVFDMEGKDVWSYQADFKFWHMDASDVKRQILAGTGDGRLFLFDFEGQVIWREQTDDWVSRISYSRDGQFAAVVLGQNRVVLYDLEDRRRLYEYAHDCVVQDVAILEDRRVFVCTNSEALVWTFEGKTLFRKPSGDRVMRIYAGLDGETAYVGHYDEGLEVFRFHDCIIRAARCYEEAKLYGMAAELYEGKNELTSAAEMYAKAGKYANAAALAEQLNNLEEAGEYYELAGDLEKAAESFEAVNLLERAAQCYDKAGHKTRASGLLAGLGDKIRAAELQLETGDFVKAGQLYHQAGAAKEASDAFERALEARTLTPEAGLTLAGLYLASERLDDVIKLLQPFRSDTDHKRDVAEMLARAFVGKGQFDVAIDHYKEALAGKEDDVAGNMETFYGFATAYEQAGLYAEARVLFRKLLLVDYYYKDVTGRIERINEMSTIFSSSDSGTMLAGGQHTMARGRPGSGSHLATALPSKPKRYDIIRKIGEGGMGVVYEARDTKLDRVVAMKVLPSKFNANDELKARFVREARAVAALSHENVVAMYDIGEEWGESYIAMEFVDGCSLRELLDKETRMPVARAMKFAIQVAQGLAAAHGAGIIHRDIKPENVMITKATEQVKIMDFGLARMDSSKENLTMEGAIMGTWRYMAPEQIRGEKVGSPTDIYATGIMIYETIAGAPPFCEGDLMFHHINTEPIPLSDLVPEVSDALNAVILRCLSKKAEDRIADGRELVEALNQAL